MKTYKSLLAAAILGLSFSSCTSLLDVNNPNYFTDDEMAEFINGSEEAEQQVLTGLVGSLPGYINTTTLRSPVAIPTLPLTNPILSFAVSASLAMWLKEID